MPATAAAATSLPEQISLSRRVDDSKCLKYISLRTSGSQALHVCITKCMKEKKGRHDMKDDELSNRVSQPSKEAMFCKAFHSACLSVLMQVSAIFFSPFLSLSLSFWALEATCVSVQSRQLVCSQSNCLVCLPLCVWIGRRKHIPIWKERDWDFRAREVSSLSLSAPLFIHLAGFGGCGKRGSCLVPSLSLSSFHLSSSPVQRLRLISFKRTLSSFPDVTREREKFWKEGSSSRMSERESPGALFSSDSEEREEEWFVKGKERERNAVVRWERRAEMVETRKVGAVKKGG